MKSLALFLTLVSTNPFAQDRLLTVAERSEFQATAPHADVVGFCRQLSAESPLVVQSSMGKTHEGRDIPLLILANPKSVLFAGAVIVVIFPEGLTTADKALIFFNHLSVELIVQPLLAVLLSTAAVRQRYFDAKIFLDRAAATILGALGIRLLLERG